MGMTFFFAGLKCAAVTIFSRQPFQHFGHLLAGDRLSYLVMVVKVERPPTAVRQMPVPGG
jgi:hypothetical protein